MTLFTVGPTQMSPRTLEVSGRQVPYFRNQTFSDVVFDCERLLLKDTYAPEGSRVIILTASGTGAMEATIINSLTKHDKALVIDGGAFGHRFVQMLELHDIEHTAITLETEEALTAAHLAPYDQKGYTALLVNLDETSTGQLYDLTMLADFVRRNNLLFIVDAISAFGADHIDMTEAGIDALIMSSQKALALSPGISIVVMSPRMLERVENAETTCMYFDFKDALKNGDRGQTPFTPAVGIIYELQDRLHEIEEAGGIEAEVSRTAALAADFRARLEGTGITTSSFPKSNAVTRILFERPIAAQVNAHLIEKYGFTLNPSGGKLGEYGSRVAHIGYLSERDNEALVAALVETLKEV